MAKGQMRVPKEKKKPKADKNKKNKHQPFGGKMPMNQTGTSPISHTGKK